MTYLSVRQWWKYQHYRDRRPIWIKLYIELLDDTEIQRLPITTRLLWDQLLLLAGRYGNVIPNDAEHIASLTLIERRDCAEGIAQLLKGRWLQETRTPRRASKSVAKKYRSASPEKEKEKDLGVSSKRGNSKPVHVWQEGDKPPDFTTILKDLKP